MNKQHRETLKQKLNNLQAKLAAEARIEVNFIQWVQEVYDKVLQQKVQHDVLFLATVDKEEKQHWAKALAQFTAYGFKEDLLLETSINPVHEAIIEFFPDGNSFRYVPALPFLFEGLDKTHLALLHCIEQTGSNDSSVLFFYERYSPVLTIPLHELVRCADVLVLPNESLFICSTKYEWLLHKDLEEEWRFGFSNPQ